MHACFISKHKSSTRSSSILLREAAVVDSYIPRYYIIYSYSSHTIILVIMFLSTFNTNHRSMYIGSIIFITSILWHLNNVHIYNNITSTWSLNIIHHFINYYGYSILPNWVWCELVGVGGVRIEIISHLQLSRKWNNLYT